MKRNRLGRSGIVVTDICLGTMTFGLQADEPASFAMMDRAVEAGLDFMDTAEVYPVPPAAETVGVTEEIVGLSVTALSVAWSRQHDFVASTIVGATSVTQLDEILDAKDLVLDAPTLRRIDEIDEAIPNPMTEDGLRRL